MAGDAANPRIWLKGDVYYAPLGTAAPTDVSTALNAAFKALGLLGTDGLTLSRENDEEEHWAWGGLLYRVVRSKEKRTFQVTALEDNDNVFKLLNPGSTVSTATGTTTRVYKVPAPNPQAFVWHGEDGTVKKRLWIPRGEVTSVDDITFSEEEPSGQALTVTVYPASDGTLFHEITNDAQAVVA